MVLPLVDEDKPKCFLCHDTFDDYESLRDHQKEKHKDFFESLFACEWKFLFDLNRELNEYILSALNINTELIYSSDLDLKEKKDALILELCQQSNATTYLSGALGRNYLNEEKFTDEGIQVVYIKPFKLIYKQPNKSFVSDLSILDYLFNNGFKNFLERDYPKFKKT